MHMKYLKLLWLISLVSFAVYFIIEWLESGFDSVLFAPVLDCGKEMSPDTKTMWSSELRDVEWL